MRNRAYASLAGVFLSALALSVPAFAQTADDPIPARVRYFEGTVTVQRAHAAETSAALVNLPLDAGDRIWTDGQGRVELTFGDGTTVWLDHLTTVDVVALPRADGATILRLWGGSLIAERPGVYERTEQTLRVDTAEAGIVLRPQGSYRIDLDDEHRVWLSVYDGTATMTAGELTEIVAAGETTYVEPGTAPAEVADFNTADNDDFSNWQIERWVAMAETQNHVRNRDYVPEAARPYAADLEGNGDWVYYDDFSSYAWRPSVDVGWAPYRNGRWVYSYAGWTWVPYASWGWATVHYGRWHQTPYYGWMWFPGSVYSPGWVSWYAGSGYLGWSPLGYYNRPFLSVNLFFGGHYGYGHGYHGGRNYDYAVRRGGKAVAGQGYARNLDGDRGWTFVDADHFGTGKTELRATSRTAIPRQGTGNAVSFEGKLRPRRPGTLANISGSGRSAVARSGIAQGTGARSTTDRGIGVRPTHPSRGAAESVGGAASRGAIPGAAGDRAKVSPRSGRSAPSTAREARPRSGSGETARPRATPRAGSGSRSDSRAGARPRSGSPSRGSSKPRAGSARRPRSGSAGRPPRTATSGASASAGLSRAAGLPTRANLSGAPAGVRPESPVSRGAISRYAPRTSQYQPQTRAYQPQTRAYQPNTNRYQASPRYSPSRPSATRYSPSIQPRSAVGSRSAPAMPRSFSAPRSFLAPRSVGAPRGSAGRRGGVMSGRSSAPSRGSMGRSSGRTATRRSGRR